MAYSKQTFSVNQVLTNGQMNQVETNIQDHKHGVSGVNATFGAISADSYAQPGTGGEALKIIRGRISAAGSKVSGDGFTVSGPSSNVYTITFQTAFSGVPAVVANCEGDAYYMALQASPTTSSFAILPTYHDGTHANEAFSFIAIGPA